MYLLMCQTQTLTPGSIVRKTLNTKQILSFKTEISLRGIISFPQVNKLRLRYIGDIYHMLHVTSLENFRSIETMVHNYFLCKYLLLYINLQFPSHENI